MKIAYVLKRFPRFSETFVLNEILALEKQGVEVEIFAMMEPSDEPYHEQLKDLKAPVHYLNDNEFVRQWTLQSGLLENKKALNLRKTLEQNALPLNEEIFPDKTPKKSMQLHAQALALALLAMARGIQHFHVHFATDATGVALLASRICKISYSFTAHAKDIYHTYINEQVDQDLLRTKINEALFVLTVSEYNRRHLMNLVDASQYNKIIRLYNGIDHTHFVPSNQPRQNNKILAVGRLVEKKGFRFLIDACAILKSRKVDFQCSIIGDGLEKDNLKNQIISLGLTEDVHLIGSQTQHLLMQTMQTVSTLVLPAIITASGDRDGLPTVLLEAKAMELPVISTSVAGIPEIIDHDQTGFLVAPEQPQALADAIEKLLKNPTKAIDMGKRGRKKSQKLFNLERNNADLYAYFKQAVITEQNQLWGIE